MDASPLEPCPSGNGSDPFPPGFGQGDALASFPPPPPRVQAASAWNATQHRPSGTAAAVQSVAQQHSPQQTSGTIAAMLLSGSSAWNTLQSITTPARTAAQGFVRTAILQVRNAARDLATPGRELKHDVPEPEWYGRMSDSIISATTDASRFPVVQQQRVQNQCPPRICDGVLTGNAAGDASRVVTVNAAVDASRKSTTTMVCEDHGTRVHITPAGAFRGRRSWTEPDMPNTAMLPTPARTSEGLPSEYFSSVSSAVPPPGALRGSMSATLSYLEPTFVEPRMPEAPTFPDPRRVSNGLLPEYSPFASWHQRDERRISLEPERPLPDPEPPPSAIGRAQAMVIYPPHQHNARRCFYEGWREESTDQKLNARDFLRSFEVVRATQLGWDDARAIAECKIRCSHKIDNELALLEAWEQQGWEIWKAAFIDRFRHINEDYDKFKKLLNACCNSNESISTFNASFEQMISDVMEICPGRPMPDVALKHIYLQAIPPTVRERAAPRLDSGMKLHAVMQLCAQTEYYASLPITSDHSQCRDNALSSASTYVIRSLPSYGSMEERHAAYRKRALRRAADARRKAGVRNVGVQTG